MNLCILESRLDNSNLSVAAHARSFIDDACEGDDESDGEFSEGNDVRDISGGVQSLLSQAENAISRHERGECVVDELRLLYSTLPKHEGRRASSW